MHYNQIYINIVVYFFFNDTATTEIYTLSLHDALPISVSLSNSPKRNRCSALPHNGTAMSNTIRAMLHHARTRGERSEEHTSELQSRQYLVCRLLLEKKKYHESDYHLLVWTGRSDTALG